MLSPRWIKALRDMARYRSRTFLVVASIAVGILAFGAIAGARAILARNLTDSFAATEPASFVLLTADFEQSLVERVSRVDGVALAEGRRRLRLRIRADGASAWQNIELYGLADFTGQTVSKVAAQSGPWPPAEGELLLERSAPDFLGLHIGDTALIEGEGELRVAGTAHDLQLFPTPLTKRGAAYVALPTMTRLGQPERFNQLLVVVAGDRMDIAQIQRVADRVTQEVEAAGVVVFQRSIPEPLQHPMDSMVQTVLVILGALGLMTLLLSGLLVVNTMAAALAGQIRQIGVMKAVGATTRQIADLYIGTALLYGMAAAAGAIPVGLAAARQLARFAGELVNVPVTDLAIPLSVVLTQAALGLLVPLLAAAAPVLGWTRVTVREALSAESGRPPTSSLLTGGTAFLPRPLLLSLRNTFRRKGRLTLTLATLSLAGAIVVTVFTVQRSSVGTTDQAAAYNSYDVVVNLSRPAPVTWTPANIGTIAGVERVEGWGLRFGFRVRPDGAQSRSDITIIAPPAGTDMIRPTLAAGRWLQPDDDRAVVINVDLLHDEPDLAVDSPITLKVGGVSTEWRVVGVVTSQMEGPTVYVRDEALARALGPAPTVARIVARTTVNTEAAQAAAADLLEAKLREAGLSVQESNTGTSMREGIDFLFTQLVLFLLVMAAMLALVGGLGLAGSMSLGVLERTREIGVMRAVGASHGSVLGIVVGEGVLIGLISWMAGSLLAWPISRFLCDAAGNQLVKSPLVYAFSMPGVALWLLLAILLSAVASYFPARRAARVPVREVLSYE